MLNKMVLFLGAPEQGLTGKIVVFLANLWIFAFFLQAERGISILRFY